MLYECEGCSGEAGLDAPLSRRRSGDKDLGLWHDLCWKLQPGPAHVHHWVPMLYDLAKRPQTWQCRLCGVFDDPCNDLGAPQGAPVDSRSTDDAKGPQISEGEQRVTSSTGGQKGQKLARFDLVPSDSLWKVAELYGAGAQKYAARNWEQGYDWSLSFAALQRHAWQFWSGEDNDAETGQPHMASVAFHALALLRFMDAHPDFDDRP